jgi:hypothetical protein
MNIEAKINENGKMVVTYNNKTLEFDTYQGRDGLTANYVFAAPVVRNGKDWPVSVAIGQDGNAKCYYPSGITYNHKGIRITGFWADSQNQSRHNKV